jgi:succinate-semialdehyde dehydrogenase/glutarate-semialdehyde dehydrogenase
MEANPSKGEIIGEVSCLGAAETGEAIDAAQRAFGAWRKETAKNRAVALRRWFDQMVANREDLAHLMGNS